MDHFIRAHVSITGRVQGVCYRMETQRVAIRYGVKGWVRNRPDGSVEGVFEGDKDSVDSLIEWCRQGPSHAQVHGMDIQWEEHAGEFNSFEIVY